MKKIDKDMQLFYESIGAVFEQTVHDEFVFNMLCSYKDVEEDMNDTGICEFDFGNSSELSALFDKILKEEKYRDIKRCCAAAVFKYFHTVAKSEKNASVSDFIYEF